MQHFELNTAHTNGVCMLSVVVGQTMGIPAAIVATIGFAGLFTGLISGVAEGALFRNAE